MKNVREYRVRRVGQITFCFYSTVLYCYVVSFVIGPKHLRVLL